MFNGKVVCPECGKEPNVLEIKGKCPNCSEFIRPSSLAKTNNRCPECDEKIDVLTETMSKDEIKIYCDHCDTWILMEKWN